MRRVLAALLIAFVLEHAPWRLMALYAEVLVITPRMERLSPQNDRYWDAQDLMQRLQAHGYRVTFEPDLITTQGAYGFTDPHDFSIHVDQSLSWNSRLAVLAHEAGHTLQPARRTQGQREAFAESVAMLVAHDGLLEHARYLASLKPDFLIEAVADWPAIYHAAEALQ